MKNVLARIPGSALRGALIALFGVLLLVWQRPTPGAVALLFGVVLLAWGAGAVLLSLSNRERPRWTLTLAEGIGSAAAGLFLLIRPELGSAVLIVLLAVWGLLGAALQVARVEVRSSTLSLLLYGASMGVGVALLVMASSAFAYAWFVGAYALFVGVLQLFSSLQGQRDRAPRGRPAEA